MGVLSPSHLAGLGALDVFSSELFDATGELDVFVERAKRTGALLQTRGHLAEGLSGHDDPGAAHAVRFSGREKERTRFFFSAGARLPYVTKKSKKTQC
jgi:hypothetical protein